MNPTSFSIGRDPMANLSIPDPSVSRFHAQATLHDGARLLIADQRSSNGTFLIRGGVERRIEQEWFGPGDGVKFGSFAMGISELLAMIQPAGAAPSPAQAPTAVPRSVQLIRCGCGAVKAVGETCPACRG